MFYIRNIFLRFSLHGETALTKNHDHNAIKSIFTG